MKSLDWNMDWIVLRTHTYKYIFVQATFYKSIAQDNDYYVLRHKVISGRQFWYSYRYLYSYIFIIMYVLLKVLINIPLNILKYILLYVIIRISVCILIKSYIYSYVSSYPKLSYEILNKYCTFNRLNTNKIKFFHSKREKNGYLLCFYLRILLFCKVLSFLKVYSNKLNYIFRPNPTLKLTITVRSAAT